MSTPTATATHGETLQFLTFCLGGEEYGVEILSIQEIKGYAPATPLPNAPPHVLGVMNLRGVIVPVIDLRRRFGLPPLATTKFSVVVVVVLRGRTIGLLVDSVSDVVSFPPTDIQDPPDITTHGSTSLLRGIARAGERLVIVLDVDRVVGLEQAAEVPCAA